MWSLVAVNGAVKTLTQHRMRMHVQRLVKEAAARAAAETYPEACLPHAEARRRAAALMNEIKASQKRATEMTEPILKRALAQPPAPTDQDAVPRLGMLGYAPKNQPKKPPVRRAPGQHAGRNGGAP
ncbi:hypothetical protein [Variovorax sp. YR566]|uniref:hypothetical protein n=1 Tax=Variovorax sp. YR566 TaxID=3450237 RepID=UPI003F7EDF95